MVTVQGPAWTLTIAALLWLLMEAMVHVREGARDLRVWWIHRRRHGTLPQSWQSSQGERLSSALNKQRRGR